MIFSIKCKENNTNKVLLIEYNNATNKFTDKDGKILNKGKRLNKYEPIKTLNSSNIKTLELLLGLKCNFKCNYCAQRNIDQKKIPDTTPKKVESFIQMLAESRLDLERISLMGGEPFVYWKGIKKLVPLLREKYKQADIRLITNGSLLDKDKVEELLKYDVKIHISYDGANSDRHEDILTKEKIVDAIRMLDRIRLMRTLSSATSTNQQIIKNFKSKGLIVNHISIQPIRSYNGNASDTKLLDKSRILQLKEEQKKLYDILTSAEAQNEPIANEIFAKTKKRFEDHAKRIMQSSSLDGDFSYCRMANAQSCVCDIDGIIWDCSCRPEKSIGTIRDLTMGVKIDLSKVYKNYYLFRRQCLECPFVIVCAGACSKPSEETIDFQVSCRNAKAIAEVEFLFAVEKAYGIRIIEVKTKHANKLIGNYEYLYN